MKRITPFLYYFTRSGVSSRTKTVKKLIVGFGIPLPSGMLVGKNLLFIFLMLSVLAVILFTFHRAIFAVVMVSGIVAYGTVLYVLMRKYGWQQMIYRAAGNPDNDTSGARGEEIKVFDWWRAGKRTVRYLRSGNLIQSAMYLDNPDELVWSYGEYYHLAEIYVDRQPRRILCLGGGAFSIPKNMRRWYPKARIDVVEIVPELAHLAKKYFFADHRAIHPFIGDARVFLEKRLYRQYDLIYVDINASGKFVFSLSTEEAARCMRRYLTKDGVLIVNSAVFAYHRHIPDSFIRVHRSFCRVFAESYALLSRLPAHNNRNYYRLTLLISKTRRFPSVRALQNAARKLKGMPSELLKKNTVMTNFSGFRNGSTLRDHCAVPKRDFFVQKQGVIFQKHPSDQRQWGIDR